MHIDSLYISLPVISEVDTYVLKCQIMMHKLCHIIRYNVEVDIKYNVKYK